MNLRVRIALVMALAMLLPVSVEAKPRPIAFWLVNATKGTTRAEAVRRCLRATTDPNLCRRHVISVRGPFVGTKGIDPDDDPRVYVYRGSNGTWYDRNGNYVTTCDSSGCP